MARDGGRPVAVALPQGQPALTCIIDSMARSLATAMVRPSGSKLAWGGRNKGRVAGRSTNARATFGVPRRLRPPPPPQAAPSASPSPNTHLRHPRRHHRAARVVVGRGHDVQPAAQPAERLGDVGRHRRLLARDRLLGGERLFGEDGLRGGVGGGGRGGARESNAHGVSQPALGGAQCSEACTSRHHTPPASSAHLREVGAGLLKLLVQHLRGQLLDAQRVADHLGADAHEGRDERVDGLVPGGTRLRGKAFLDGRVGHTPLQHLYAPGGSLVHPLQSCALPAAAHRPAQALLAHRPP
jgi:hypothetical protein